ncbi:MAG: hypothetical protein V7739_01630 [Motiliproteus sp.]
MANIEVRNRERVIEELRGFIKKVLVEPEIIATSLEITRRLIDEDDADHKISEQLSATTNVKIPAKHSEADQLFIDLLKEVVRDEHALY